MNWQRLVRFVEKVNNTQRGPSLKLSIPSVVLAGLGLLMWGQSEGNIPPVEFVPSGVDSTALRIVGFNDEEKSVIQGKALFDQYCVVCHGEDGDGQGPNSRLIRNMIGQTPRDFTDPDYWRWIKDAEVEESIKYGGGSIKKLVLMPLFKDMLSDQEVRDLISYLKTFPPVMGED